MPTENVTKETVAALEATLNSVTKSLPKITSKKMFGCHAVWANDNVFALVWKHGRIGVKLPDETSYELLMGQTGATPWKAGPMQMAHWVLVPVAFHSKPGELKKWAAKAHQQCSVLEKKPKKTAKAAPMKAAKKAVKRAKA